MTFKIQDNQQNSCQISSMSSHRSSLMNSYPQLVVFSLWWWHHTLPQNSIQSKQKGDEQRGCNGTRDQSISESRRVLWVGMSGSCSRNIALLHSMWQLLPEISVDHLKVQARHAGLNTRVLPNTHTRSGTHYKSFNSPSLLKTCTSTASRISVLQQMWELAAGS